MGRPCKCCGVEECPLGSDDFTRPDSCDIGPKWEQLSGCWRIRNDICPCGELIGTVENVLQENKSLGLDCCDPTDSGILATSICHPPNTLGSLYVTFTLYDLHTRTEFAVRVGDPNGGYNIVFKPNKIEIDNPDGTKSVTGTIKCIVSGARTHEFDYPWPVGVITCPGPWYNPGGPPPTCLDVISGFVTGLLNEVNVVVCYMPGAQLSGTVGVTGGDDPVEVCLDKDDDAEPCYDAVNTDGENVKVGNFSFLKGRFRNWRATITYLDNVNCGGCGCFCYIPRGDSIDYACYPDVLALEISFDNKNCMKTFGDTKKIKMVRGLLGPNLPPDYRTKEKWFSERVGTVCGFDYSWILSCGSTNPAGLLELGLGGTAWSQGGNSVFDFVGGGTASPPRLATATCDPLYLEYPNIIVKSPATASCGNLPPAQQKPPFYIDLCNNCECGQGTGPTYTATVKVTEWVD